MSLLASTLGVEGTTRRTEVKARLSEMDDHAEFRLVVQSYDGSMRHGARPVGSFQRVVTVGELRRGIRVSLVELRDAAKANGSKALVVAWIDPGKADLEYDARAARPAAGSIFGAARSSSRATVQISLNRRLPSRKLAAA